MTKNILVAPLNWGLGHATRCIPIIAALENHGYTPILASDGVALALLKKEFPHLLALELPSYDIKYPKKARNFMWKMLMNTPKTLIAMESEKKRVHKWIAEYQLDGIISDNRLGVHSKKVPSVFITHQLTVLSGKTTWLTSKLHQFYIKKFNECWVPDSKNIPNLSGKLGHLENTTLNIKYIGALSRLQKQEIPIIYDIMVLLSGPEPQRTLLEMKIIEELKEATEKIVFIKGKIEAIQTVEQIGNITFYNFMQTKQLEKTLNESMIVLCRSGYTTMMDLAKLEKKALLIPTPGQFEQEFLAKKFKQEGILPMVKQNRFKRESIYSVSLYPGLPKVDTASDWLDLFNLFKGK
jgi:uncharacterized protein (TIGR00661 family)